MNALKQKTALITSVNRQTGYATAIFFRTKVTAATNRSASNINNAVTESAVKSYISLQANLKVIDQPAAFPHFQASSFITGTQIVIDGSLAVNPVVQ